MAKRTAEQVRQEITDKIIKGLEGGKIPWRCPWSRDPNCGMPVNIASKKQYRGVNPLVLAITAMDVGYDSKWWGTYKQWKDRGGQVRRGEKSSPIVFWKIIEKDEVVDGELKKKKIFFMRWSSVFNLDQVDGEKLDKFRPVKQEAEEITVSPDFTEAQALVDNSGAKITHGGNRACHRPSIDDIMMPNKSSFDQEIDYYQTIFHELSHWSETRVPGFDRVQGDKHSYAMGELIAEIGGCYVSSGLDLPLSDDLENHTAYLQSWLEAMKNDVKFIFKASQQASKVANYLLDFVGKGESNGDGPTNEDEEIDEAA
jgi:antirestriction protein ArdC